MQNTDKMGMRGRGGTAQKVFPAALEIDNVLSDKPLSFVRKSLQLPEGYRLYPAGIVKMTL